MPLRQLLHRFRQLDVWLVAPAIAFVIWGELAHAHIIAVLEFDIWDKALHFTAYLGLALMTTTAVRGRPVTAVWLAFGLIVLGGVLEIAQGMTSRDADLWDEAANTLGVLAGTGTALAAIGYLRARKLVGDEGAD